MPINRFTAGGKSTQPNGSFGERCTRCARTAATGAQAGSLETFAAKSWSMVMITSGSHNSTCSIETLASPLGVPPATFCATNSIVSTLIEPPSPVSSPRGPRGVVDARPSVRRDRAHTLRDGFHRVFGVARKALALLAPPDQCAERAVAQRNALETAVEQCVGNTRLLLHAVGERDVGRVHAADVEDEIGFEREHDFEIGGVAAPGDAAHFGSAADVGQEEFAFLRPVGARPADEQFGRERVEKDRGRWSRRKDALDTRGRRHDAAGAVGHARGARTPRRQQGRSETCDQRAATVGHHTPIMTSDALMTAQASSPVLRLRSATASFVIEDVMTMPLPISIRTWDGVVPFLTSTILPLSWLRALSFFMVYSFQEFVFMARCHHGCGRRQRLIFIGCPATISICNCLLMTLLKRGLFRLLGGRVSPCMAGQSSKTSAP